MAFEPISRSIVEICFVFCSHCEGWLGTRSCSTKIINVQEIICNSVQSLLLLSETAVGIIHQRDMKY
jgi:hypothetical protein